MAVAYSDNLIYNSRVDRFATEKADSDRPATLIHRMNTTEVFMIKKVCPICGQEFNAKRNSAIYCSRECSAESQKKYKICPTCGKQFNSHNPKQIYCSISCGVHSRDKHLEGQKFGRWTVLERTDKNLKTGCTMWLCRCECGTEKAVSELSLVNGKSKSCGCLHKDSLTSHNMSYSRIYNVWGHIKSRCTNPKHHAWKDYGGRGIALFSEWQEFENFYNWAINNGYKNNLSIDRIDVNGNYEPNNCHWVTNKEQSRNRRNNKLITYNNETHCMAEWADILNIDYQKLKQKMRKHNNFKQAIIELGGNI